MDGGPLREFEFDWKKPEYCSVFAQRVEKLDKIRELAAKDEHFLPNLRGYYKRNIPQFIVDWGCTFDPRNPERNLPSLVPFILFPKQVEWVNWVLERWRTSTPGLTEKSREMGITALAAALASSMSMFYEGISIGFGSRKQEYVDRVGEPRSILEKVRTFMRNVPPEFRGSWNVDKHAPTLHIIFPDTGSTISGEAGDDIGRGDRKAQPLTAKILTPTGWRKMGQITQGDLVIGGDGKPTKVIGVSPRGIVEIFRIGFTDGSSTECCDDHLWRVTTRANRKYLNRMQHGQRKKYKNSGKPFDVIPLKEFRDSLIADRIDGKHELKYQIPVLTAPVKFVTQNKINSIDPYLLGALLGDGSISNIDVASPGFTTSDTEIIDLLRDRIPNGCSIVSNGSKYGYVITDNRGKPGRGYRSPIKSALRDIGLDGKTSHTKFVPDCYKFSSKEDRLEVLRGLMDTDGWSVTRKGGVSSSACFMSTSMRLIDDVRFLVQSLGGVARTTDVAKGIRRFPDGSTFDFKGGKQLVLCMPAGMNPFRLSRKAMKWRDRTKYIPSRGIVSVESIGKKQAQCITVESKDGLYVTDDCIVTHNSIYFVDESAHLDHPDLVDQSLSMTTNCRIDMSSVKGLANSFARKRFAGKIPLFIFDWHDDPRKDQAWYDKKNSELDKLIVAQEIDRNYAASVEGVVIPAEWAMAAIDAHKRLNIQPTGARSGALDVADSGTDTNAFTSGHGILIEYVQEWTGNASDIYATAEQAVDICDKRNLDSFKFDSDGLGAGVRGDARKINEERKKLKKRQIKVDPFRGSEGVSDPEKDNIVKGRKNKDYFANCKAQSWWKLRIRFENTFNWVTKGIACDPDEIVSISSEIPNHLMLISELSQPTYGQNQIGKMLINKTPEGAKSPNMGDSVMIYFSNPSRTHMKISPQALRRA